MSNSNHTSRFRAARQYRWAAIALIVLGVLAVFVGGRIGYGTAGLVVYVVAALAGLGLIAYVRLSDSLAFGDERLCELERRTSHYTAMLLGGLGWVGLVGASLLEATGQRAMSGTEETLLSVLVAFFLVWGLVYLVLRLRS